MFEPPTFGSPKKSAIPLLALVEFWERFNKYALRAFLVIYLIAPTVKDGGYGLGWAIGDAIPLYSFFIACAYITPLGGGFISDNVLGAYKSTLLGCILIAIGQLVISMPHDWLPNHESTVLFFGLFFFTLGNGLFKPNIATLVGSVSKFYSLAPIKSYNLFFMITNFGGVVSGIALGSIVVWFDGNYQVGFFIAALGMLLGLLILLAYKSLLDVQLPSHNCSHPRLDIALSDSDICDKKSIYESPSTLDKKRISFIIVMGLFSIFFWLGYEQMAGSINVVTQRYTDRHLFGYEIPTAWFQSLTPLFNMMLAPVFYILWNKLKLKNRHLDIPNKMMISLLSSTFAFVIMSFCTSFIYSSFANQINMWWIVIVYFCFSVGEILFAPTCLSAINEYISEKYVGLVMGLWFLFYAIASLFAGALGHGVDPNSSIDISKGELLENFTRLFVLITLLSLMAAVCLFVSRKKIIKLLQLEV
ncbi:MAG: peptide MFS transporter [Shewanella sp.]|nr:peptide MFS transporter [Shewanella sp.]